VTICSGNVNKVIGIQSTFFYRTTGGDIDGFVPKKNKILSDKIAVVVMNVVPVCVPGMSKK